MHASGTKATIWPVLGLVRFLLALVVAASHLSWFVDKGDVVARLSNFSGFVAVFGFFVISGYSIAASFKREPLKFYYRRAVRILPMYIPLTVLSAVLPIFFPGGVPFADTTIQEPSYRELFLNLCFAQGFAVISLETNPVVWTLAIEIFFYALTPLVARISNRSLLIAACTSAIAYVSSDSLVSLNAPSMLFGESVLLTGWAWLLGFWIYRADDDAVLIALLIGVFAITLNHAGIENWWIFTWSLPLLVIKFAGRINVSAPAAKAFLFAGDVSYPLYLVHFPCYLLLGSTGFPITGSLLLALATAVAVVLTLVYEKPIKRLIVRFCDGSRAPISSG